MGWQLPPLKHFNKKNYFIDKIKAYKIDNYIKALLYLKVELFILLFNFFFIILALFKLFIYYLFFQYLF